MNWKALGLSILAVFAPVKAIIITVGVIIAGDFVTGVWAAKKQGQPITSAGFRRTLTKFIIYQFAVLSGFMLQNFILENIVPVVNIVAGVIGMIEFKSMLENSSKIVGQDVFKLIIAKLGSHNDALAADIKKVLKDSEASTDKG